MFCLSFRFLLRFTFDLTNRMSTSRNPFKRLKASIPRQKHSLIDKWLRKSHHYLHQNPSRFTAKCLSKNAHFFICSQTTYYVYPTGCISVNPKFKILYCTVYNSCEKNIVQIYFINRDNWRLNRYIIGHRIEKRKPSHMLVRCFLSCQNLLKTT